MNPALLAASGALLIFCLCLAASKLLTGSREEVNKRIKELSADKASEGSKPVRKKVRRKKNIAAFSSAKARKQLEKLEDELYDTGLQLPAQQFLMIWITSAILIPTLLTMLGAGAAVGAVLALVIAAGPIIYIKVKKKKRRTTLESQLVEAISVLCNALRAGHSFQQAMNTITQEMNGPIAEEFGRVFRETQHGMTMADSMGRMVERTGSADLEMLCTAILIQRDVGGNLAEVLENISTTIQRRLALKAEIKTRTASGRLSGYIIGCLPILLLVALSVINPEYSSNLFTTELGHTMLIIGGVMEVIGFIVINKMVSVKY